MCVQRCNPTLQGTFAAYCNKTLDSRDGVGSKSSGGVTDVASWPDLSMTSFTHVTLICGFCFACAALKVHYSQG